MESVVERERSAIGFRSWYIVVDLEGGGNVQLHIGILQTELRMQVLGYISNLSQVLFPGVRSVVVSRRETGERTGFIWSANHFVELDRVLPDTGFTNATPPEEIEKVLREKFVFCRE